MIEYGLSNIPSLVSAWDIGNPKCYSGVGIGWKDLISGQTTLGDQPWMNNISTITISIIIEKLAPFVGYAEHPIAKWNNGYQNNASFILYHFGDGNDGVLSWNYNATQDLATGWTGVGGPTLKVGVKQHVVLQHNSLFGSNVWSNGVKIVNRGGSASLLGQTILPTNNITYSAIFLNGIETFKNSTIQLHHVQFYKRELSDQEVYYLYGTHKSRFGLS